MYIYLLSPFFFFNDTATTDIYTLSLHDALPISFGVDVDSSTAGEEQGVDAGSQSASVAGASTHEGDRKSTRLNSSHRCISYAVFCLKKKKTNNLYCKCCSIMHLSRYAMRSSTCT